ncbi:MAG: bifunctional 5,10-methylenetetrahydrofolate dehydrogenase/5,10-methenyltetrahydrofolate cyclohydrolase [Candidatus Magasanikbacteria bacterium]|nr:bifunctional 5,10-methylenetetrahydrofolate dehydrogenase/5,10-methenyltetrahydrofolate cyclohydrolase [Candidatus Magasanikbacteria bacterium]
MDNIIDGKALRDKILGQLKAKIEKHNLKPYLAIIQVGENESSNRYIKQKLLAAEKIGAKVELINFPENVTQQEIETKIAHLNADNKVSGIIVQLPLPEHLQSEKLVELISPNKDVDGLTENSAFKPATPSGVMKILEEYKVNLKDKTVVVLGRSKLVGSPLKKMLEDAGAEVIQIHSQTPKPIDSLVQKGDIVISAVGQPKLVTANMVKKGAVVIDVGMNRDPETGKLVGDVDFENVSKKASLITPVPGGVGPMTVAMLMTNLVKASK